VAAAVVFPAGTQQRRQANENKKSSHTRNIYPHLPSRKKQAGYINHKIIKQSQIANRNSQKPLGI
jgi:hypothetical protein